MSTAESCLARYKAENIDYARGIGGSAATLGSSVHGALEMYVKAVYINKSQKADLKLLLDLFKMSYMTTFGTADLDTEDYSDGVEMLKAWFKRTSLDDVTVISAEVKDSFPIKTSIGEIPFNYIFDRFDQTGENEYTVTDYKTNRWGINPADLKKKIQARAYGLLAQIKYPNAEKIWVQFDMLRHEGPVGIVFSRDDNIATWGFLKQKAEQIISTPDDKTPETLNPDCLFCVRKHSCNALKSNLSVGGVFKFIGNVAEVVDHRAELDSQKRAVEAAIKEIDEIILSEAKEADLFEFESETNTLSIGVRRTRAIDPDMAARVIGDELFRKYGGTSFTIGATEKLLKGDELTDAQKRDLRGLIYMNTGQPSVKTAPKNPIDGE